MDELLSEFISETLETLETISGEVVAWEANPRDERRLDAFFRFFHTVKGSCGFLDLPRFERLSHAAEDVLAAVRNGERKPDAETVTAVLSIMDRIGLIARALAEGAPPPEDDDARLLDALSQLPATNESDRQLTMSAHEAPTERSRSAAQRTVRLPLALIDQLMNGVSDMVLARNEMSRKMRDRSSNAEMESSFERLSNCVADLRDAISKTRMQRVDRLYAAIPRMVRDLGRDLGRSVVVELEGGDVEMDREMIEMVVDPLTHIVRNAVDHGIETPVKRRAAGKPETGTLRMRARQSGNQIAIEISDDGNGINRAALVERALAKRLITPAQAQAMSPDQQIALIFEPGLSTAKAVTAISGRGVGMDVVRANVEQIGGTIGIDSTPGVGTTFMLRVPLTLTIIPGLIIRAGGRCFALPRGAVIELLHESNAMVRMEKIAQGTMAAIRGERRSMIDLEDVLGLERPVGHAAPRTLLVVRATTGQPYVLGVEAVENIEELVIRPASPLVTASGLYAGMTLPDNGQPMLLLDAAGIAAQADFPADDVAERSGVGLSTAAVEMAATVQGLRFVGLDDVERVMPLHVIDRVEDVPAEAFGCSQGRTFVQLEGMMVPSAHPPVDMTSESCCLRLRAGDDVLCYPIKNVVDIIDMPEQVDLVAGSDLGGLAGISLIEGRYFERIDPFLLFAACSTQHQRHADQGFALKCLLANPDDAWMNNMLAPLLRQAGYDVLLAPTGSCTPDIVLESDQAVTPVTQLGVPVLRLRSTMAAELGGDDSVFRYDKAAVLAAIELLARKDAA